MQELPDKPIILFDGICNLCNASVRFILKNDTQERFLFSSLQSDAAKKLLLHLNYKNNQMKSILFVDDGQILKKSEAALAIASGLRFPYRLAAIFKVIPRQWRDGIYDLIARNRYSWFGKQDTCVFSLEEYENRFI